MGSLLEDMSGMIDPVSLYGDQVIFHRNKFPLHATITWNDIVPVWQEERNNDQLRMLIPSYGSIVTENQIEYEGESEYPEFAIEEDRQQILSTLVTHTKEFYNQRTLDVMNQEAFIPFNLQEVNCYSNILAESFVFDTHKDPMSIFIIQTIGMSEYTINDNTYILEPGDGIYIPRETYHKPRIFGPRSMFSYYWNPTK